MPELPHIMVAGKARTFDWKQVDVEGRQVLLISVPENRMALVGLDGSYVQELV
jgi:hypothetical protein